MQQLTEFLATTPYKESILSIASADASFRKYYRLTQGEKSYLLMDASLEKSSLEPFLDVSRRLREACVSVPEIFTQDLEHGYLVIEDFGDRHLLSVLDKTNFKTLYKQAIDELIKMQKADTTGLPLYDKKFLHFEMDLMQEWYLGNKLGITLTPSQQKILDDALHEISESVLEQPQNIFVHRDYHSRNIMVREDGSLGIIDYQDAMSGALLYDLVSLLKDCYIAFERENLLELVLYFKEQIGSEVDDATFIKWFDFMGLQRHIKVLGIFSRLHLRDGKDGYLKDIPLTLKYTIDTALRYKETAAFGEMLRELTL